MKAVKIEVLGKERYLCNSVRVTKGIVQRFGGTSQMRDALTGGDTAQTLDAVVWLIQALLDGGYRYAKIQGLECPEPPTEDELLDGYDLTDLSSLQTLALKAMTDTSKPDVEATAVKNGEATGDQ